MAERPLLVLDSPFQDERIKKRPTIPPSPIYPKQERQVQRFKPKFERLSHILDKPDGLLALRKDPTTLAPDRALVFEVVGSLTDFANQATRAGFTFLGEFDNEFDQDEDFYFEDSDKKIRSTLYLLMPDLQAMRELLSLWRRFTTGKEFERGSGQWKILFSKLHTIRPWGPEDRITPRFKDLLFQWMESEIYAPFRFEIDLWFSKSNQMRERARLNVVEILSMIKGDLLHESVIPEINYHGLLCLINKESIEFFFNIEDSPLSIIDEIMYLNPMTMSVHQNAQPMGTTNVRRVEATGPSYAALLDGFPLSNHIAIEGRINIDDFLDLENYCPAERRSHGTAMASLILNGDLHSESEQPLNNVLIALPVLRPDPENPDIETVPNDRLTIDIIYRAIKRLKEGEDDSEPIGENVTIINHSIADQNAPYSQRISPWARLLDYLSFKYKILFIVSAGNYIHSLPIEECKTVSEFENLEQESKYEVYCKALAFDMRNRQVYSPAEGINSITVGAWHADLCRSGTPPGNLMDVLPNEDGPSIISAVGLGHRRSVKPDFFYDGGRPLVNVFPNGDCCALQPLNQPNRFSGQKVAAPSSRGETDRTTNICGTSNSAALLTRQAIKIQNMLEDLSEHYLNFHVPISHTAVMIKVLLAHGCDWGIIGQRLERIIEPSGSRQWSPRRTNISRLLGLGRPNIERVIDCTAQRATMIAWGTLEVDQAHTFLVPLPDSLSDRRELRRMTVSLAWLSPVNVLHQQYRQAILDIILDSKECGTERKSIVQVPTTTIGRGTLLHHIYEGNKKVRFDQDLELRIECRQQAGSLDDEIPYGLAVSFEVGQGSDIDVYNQMRERIEQRQRITPITV